MCNAVFVSADARALNRVLAEIGAEYLHGNFKPHLREHFYQRDGMRVYFFPGGTSRHPHAHRIGTGTVGENCWIDHFSQALENLRIAEKAGDVNQNVAV